MTTVFNLTNDARSRARQIETTVELITPDVAGSYLSKNIDNNRALNRRRVTAYARDMKSGDWALSESIKFDEYGQLFDGQHRLSAVIAANASVEFIVSRGFPSESVEYVDLGQARNAKNIAAIRGLTPDNASMSVVRAMIYPRYAATNHAAISAHDVVNIYQRYHQSIDFTYVTKGEVNHTVIRAAVARAHAWGENHQRLSEFLSVVADGYPVSADPANDSAAIALRNHYLKEKIKTGFKADKSRLSLFNKSQASLKNFLSRIDSRVVRESKRNHWPLPDIDNGVISENLR